MAAHRYWRASSFDTLGREQLAISEFHLEAAGVRVDGPATLTCNPPPTNGSLADLQDSASGTTATWPRSAYAKPGFNLVWDFGASLVSVDRVAVSGPEASKFPTFFRFEFSDDGAEWVTMSDVARLAFISAGVLSRAELFNLGFGNHAALGLSNQSRTARAGAINVTQWALRTTSNNTGKFYWEVHIDEAGLGGNYTFNLGIARPSSSSFDLYAYWANQGAANANGGDFTSAGVPSFTTGDTLMFALDLDGHRMFIGLNGNWVTDPVVGINPTFYNLLDYDWASFMLAQSEATTRTATLPSTFAYSVPAGYTSLRPAAGDFAEPPVQTFTAESELFLTSPKPSVIMTKRVGLAMTKNIAFGGGGYITGTVKYDTDPIDLPLKRRVRLFSEKEGILVRETWSDPSTGAYEFNEVDPAIKYTVIAYDHLHDYRAVIADNITPGAAT